MFYSCFVPSTRLEQTKINKIYQDFLRFNNFPTPPKKTVRNSLIALAQNVCETHNWSGLPNWAMRWKFRRLGPVSLIKLMAGVVFLRQLFFVVHPRGPP